MKKNQKSRDKQHQARLLTFCRKRIRIFLFERGVNTTGLSAVILYDKFALLNGLKLPEHKKEKDKFFIDFFYNQGNKDKFKCSREKIKINGVKRDKHPFYDSEDWIKLKRVVYGFYKKKCMKCGVSKTELHIDHIKPRSKYPHLSLHYDNMQVLCKRCNITKSNTSEIDYRPPSLRLSFLQYLEKNGHKCEVL